MDSKSNFDFKKLPENLMSRAEFAKMNMQSNGKLGEEVKREKEYRNTDFGAGSIYSFVNQLLSYQIEGVKPLVGDMTNSSRKDVLCIELDEYIFEVAKVENSYHREHDILIKDKETHIPIAVAGGKRVTWRLMNDELPFVENKLAGVSERHLLLLEPESYAAKYLVHIIKEYKKKIEEVKEKIETLKTEETKEKMENKYRLKWEKVKGEQKGTC